MLHAVAVSYMQSLTLAEAWCMFRRCRTSLAHRFPNYTAVARSPYTYSYTLTHCLCTLASHQMEHMASALKCKFFMLSYTPDHAMTVLGLSPRSCRPGTTTKQRIERVILSDMTHDYCHMSSRHQLLNLVLPIIV